MDLKVIPNIKFLDSNNFFLIAGPCAIESEEMAFQIAERTSEITDKLNIPFIFKGSFKKANRSRIDSFTGIGDEKALNILKKIGDINIHFDIMDMEIAEDCQLVIFHILKQAIVESCQKNGAKTSFSSNRYEKRVLEDLNA